MKAMLLTEHKKLEITDVADPKVADDELFVRVKTCGICGSDVHGFDGASGRRIPPLIMGHEAAGVVEQIGAGASDFKVGDRVTFDSMIWCGHCDYCQRDMRNMCESRRVLGVSCNEYRRDGAFAEYVNVPQRIVYPLPDELSFEQAAMIEPVSVAVHAVNRTPLQTGDTAIVIGAGMIGQLCTQALRAAGCKRVYVTDIDDSRLEQARSLGADEAFNARTTDVAAEVLRRTSGRGADVALEAVGATDPINTAIKCLRKGGALTLVGNVTPTVELPLQAIVTRELQLTGTCGCNGEYPQCIDMISRGVINVDGLITAVAPLDDGPAWFDRLYRGEPGLMKVILQP